VARGSVGIKRAKASERKPQQRTRPSNEDSSKLRDRIAIRAFEMFEGRGRAHGRDWEDWFRAEQEVLNARGNADLG
jgi:Protein of unknown function (DUF2934)